MLPCTDHGYYAPLFFSILRLQFFSLIAPSSFMRVVEPSCLPPLPSMQWVSSLFLAAQLPLPLFDFPISKIHGFRLCSAAGTVLRRRSSILSSFPPKLISPPKLAASSVVAGPCSNSPLTLTCGSPSSHFQRDSPAAA